MLLETNKKHKYNQFTQIDFDGDSEDEFEKYVDFLNGNSKHFKEEIKDKDEDEVEKIKNRWKGKLEKEIKEKLERTFNHEKSIYPSDTEYGEDNMLVDTTNNRIIFYEIYKNGDDKECVTIHKCPHYKDFIKDLEEKGIEPKKDADASILLDLLRVERHIATNESPNNKLSKKLDKEFNEREKELKKKLESQKESQKEESDKEKGESKDSDNEKETKEEKEEVTDPETGKKIKKVKHTGPRGGHYYINDKGEHIYPEEWNESIKNMKSVKSYITESKMVSLIDYLKKMVG